MYDLVVMRPSCRSIDGLLISWSLASPVPAAAQVLLDTMTRQGDGFVADLALGGVARLTLNSALQDSTEQALAAADLPFAAAVALSIPDGRVLALAGRSSLDPALGPAELALRPWAPAASVFKIVAAAALVSEAGLSGRTRTCYHGGVSAVMPQNLIDIPSLDRTCATLGYGIGKSQNAIIAKLVTRHLGPEALGRAAAALGFGETIAFDAEVEPSQLRLPEEPLELARAAAGFWHSSLSALHGALIAGAVASGGRMPGARLVDRAIGLDGRHLPVPVRPARQVLAPRVAREIGRMMELTTTIGTARASFRDARGRSLLPVSVAGKTGTLSYRGGAGDPILPAAPPRENGPLGYSWFVGYAPVSRPRLAFAVVLGHPAGRRIKASVLARQLVSGHIAAETEARGGARILAHASRISTGTAIPGKMP